METFKLFSNIDEIVHGVFDRSDVPKGEHTREWYKEDLVKTYVEKMGFEKLALPDQRHTSDVVITTETFPQSPIADAIVTKTPRLVIGVQTADCVPVLLCDPVAKVIGAAHAGWKGAIGTVVENTIKTMIEQGATLKNIITAIGPCINQESYEVDAPVYDPAINADPENKRFFKQVVSFARHPEQSEGSSHISTSSLRRQGSQPEKWLFDLKGLVKYKLEKTGVSKIEISSRDSYRDPACFSYRCATHENNPLPEEMRMFSLIALK